MDVKRLQRRREIFYINLEFSSLYVETLYLLNIKLKLAKRSFVKLCN